MAKHPITKKYPLLPSKLTNHRIFENAEEVFALPTPQGGGTLFATLECGSCVASVYQHKNAKNFEYTVTFEHQVTKDNGTIQRSPRLSSTDLHAVRILAEKVGELIQVGLFDPWQSRVGRRYAPPSEEEKGRS